MEFNLEHNLKIHLTILRYLGLWRNKDSTFLYTLLTVFMSFCITTLTFSAIAELCILLDDLEVFMSLCYMAVSVIIICVKSNYFIKYCEDIEELTKGLQKNKPKLTARQNRLINDYMNKWNTFFILMGIVIPIIGT